MTPEAWRWLNARSRELHGLPPWQHSGERWMNAHLWSSGKSAQARRKFRLAGCEACGGRAEALHHHDYAKPLDVIPVCWSCHLRIHHGSLPEPRTGRVYPEYRSPVGGRRTGAPALNHDLIVKAAGPRSRALLDAMEQGIIDPAGVVTSLGGTFVLEAP